jgi:hypothetical protein
VDSPDWSFELYNYRLFSSHSHYSRYSFDIYRKVPKDLTQPTLAGAIISISCVAFIAFLFCSELYGFLNVDVYVCFVCLNYVCRPVLYCSVSELYVDDPEKVGRISVSISVSLPHLDCDRE